MSHYDLYIECKACREENHSECSAKRTYNDDGKDIMVQIKCICENCAPRHKKSSIETAEPLFLHKYWKPKNGKDCAIVETNVEKISRQLPPVKKGLLNKPEKCRAC